MCCIFYNYISSYKNFHFPFWGESLFLGDQSPRVWHGLCKNWNKFELSIRAGFFRGKNLQWFSCFKGTGSEFLLVLLKIKKEVFIKLWVPIWAQPLQIQHYKTQPDFLVDYFHHIFIRFLDPQNYDVIKCNALYHHCRKLCKCKWHNS